MNLCLFLLDNYLILCRFFSLFSFQYYVLLGLIYYGKM